MEIVPHIKPLYTPNDYHNLDQNYGSNWQLDMINAEDAWDITKGSSTIPIAILEKEKLLLQDNNFDFDHEDLADNIISHNDNITPVASHGTFVAGCASAVTDNNKGLSSIGFNSGLMLYRGTHPDNMIKAVNIWSSSN